MKRLNIAACVCSLIAIVGWAFIYTQTPGGKFLFMLGIYASVAFFLINAFWLISKKRLSAGASMYCNLLLYLFIMFSVMGYEGAFAMACAGFGFYLLAIGAKILEIKRAKKQGLALPSFDNFMCFSTALIAFSSLILNI